MHVLSSFTVAAACCFTRHNALGLLPYLPLLSKTLSINCCQINLGCTMYLGLLHIYQGRVEKGTDTGAGKVGDRGERDLPFTDLLLKCLQ